MNLMQLLLRLFNEVQDLNTLSTVEQMYSWLASKKGLTSNVLGFVQLSLAVMKRLETNNKVNLVINLVIMIAQTSLDHSSHLTECHLGYCSIALSFSPAHMLCKGVTFSEWFFNCCGNICMFSLIDMLHLVGNGCESNLVSIVIVC